MPYCQILFSNDFRRQGDVSISTNAVIYARYSSDSQQAQSITGQLRDCRAFCEKNDLTVIKEYTDEALSARTDKRPGFQQMIKDSKQGRFEIVVVWKLDRFSRDRYDSAHYKHILKQNGVRVISAMEPISTDPEGILLESFLEGMAEYYSANLSENVKRGQRESMLQHNWLGSQIPFGYYVQDKKLKPNPETAPIVRQIFKLYSEGIGKKEIVSRLKLHDVRTNYGKPVTITTLEHILSNQKYIGVFSYGEMSYQDEDIRIIDDDLFQRVQDKLHQRYRTRGQLKAKVNYLLSGKCFCGHCGALMVGESGKSRSGSIHNYYSCRNRKKAHTCSKRNEQKLSLEKYVVQQTCEYFLNPVRLSKTADEVIEAFNREYNTGEIDALEKEIRKLESQAQSTVDLIVEAAGNKTLQKRYEEKLIEMDERKEALQEELIRLQVALGVMLNHDEVVAWLREMCTGDAADPEFQQKVIDCFVNSVYVFDDKITIFYNVRDGQQVSYQGTIEAIGGVSGSDKIGFRPPKS